MSLYKNETIRLAYDYNSIASHMVDQIKAWLPFYENRPCIVLCIGTDRSTGDSLGPLTGTLLQKKKLRHISVYGTLHEPIHALNLENYLSLIRREHDHPFIIAIDACLGRTSSVGDIIAGKGSILPGAAVNKKLPAVGDIFITGVINVSGFLEYTVLQSTRLSLVFDMAKSIAEIVEAIDRQHTAEKYPSLFKRQSL